MDFLKILVVEDESIIAQDICAMLNDSGYNVVGCATNTNEAIAIFKQEKPDLVLMDIQIDGELDGVQTAILFNAIRIVPIIYLTAQADDATFNRAKNTNPAAYLLKPFNSRGLQISIELALKNYSQMNETASVANEVSVKAHNIKLNADSILKKGDIVFLKQNYRFIKLQAEDILYIEADRNHSYLITKKQKLVLRMALAQVVERLAFDRLVRIHRSFAINMQYVEEFDDNEIVINGKSIPFSASHKEDFLKKFSLV